MEPTSSGRPDAELVGELSRGDAGALSELYDRHADALYRVAFRRLGDRSMAEEVLQDTYLALWNRAELFDPAQGSLLAWLSTIARNRAVDRLRALGRRPPTMPLSALVPDDPDDRALERALAAGALVGGGAAPGDPEHVLDAAGLREEVRDVLGVLTREERQVIELAYYEELTQSEIAARLGWPLGTVKTRTRRALARLRETLVQISQRVGETYAYVAPPQTPPTPLPVAIERPPDQAAPRPRISDGSR